MSYFKPVLAAGVVFIGSAVSIYTGTKVDEDFIIFNFEGSSSMKPIMEFLVNKYAEQETSKKVVFNISTVGSNSGLKKLLSGSGDFALVSHDISHLPKSGEYKSAWESNKLKTITLATEAMVVLYKPPEKCTQELTLSQNNIKKFYSLFSGFNAPDVKSPIKFSDLLDNTSDENCKVDVHAWVKSTGPVKSGTSKAFVENPLFRKKCMTSSGSENSQCNNECDSWCKKVISGYGEEYKLNYVPEPTNLHWDSFQHNLRDGSMTYLPSNFVLQNWDTISNLKIKLAKYKKDDSTTLELKKDQSNASEQEWVRSYNIVYSTSDINTNSDKKKLLEFLVNHSKDLSELKLIAKTYCAKGSNGCSESEIDVATADLTTETR